MNKQSQFKRAASLARAETVFEAIAKHGPIEAADLAPIVGMSLAALRMCIKQLHESPKRIRVHGWRRNRAGPMAARWVVGDGKDKAKEPFTNAELLRRHRRDPEVRLRQEKRKQAKLIQPYRDPLTAALFGQA